MNRDPHSSSLIPHHSNRIEVAAAVILRADGRFLLAQRPAGKAYAGYWEFPGGKIERGESADDALRRELHEELGVDAITVFPWVTREFDYSHALVRLRFFRVVSWRGEPHGREAQQLAWQSTRDLVVAPLLPANGPILRALDLPPVYGITRGGPQRAAMGGRLARALRRASALQSRKDIPSADLSSRERHCEPASPWARVW